MARCCAPYLVACASAHSVQAWAAAQDAACRFPPGRVGPPIAIVTGQVEGPQQQVEKLRAALARKGVAVPAIDLYVVDEREPAQIGDQLTRLPLAGRSAVVTLSGFVARALAAGHGSPVVFATRADPVELGLLEGMTRRNVDVTGISYSVPMEWKFLEHLRTAFPSVRRAGMLADRYYFQQALLQELVRDSRERTGIEVLPFVAESRAELEAAFADKRAAAVDAWIVPETSIVFRQEARVLELVLARKIPNIFGHPSLLEKGALMAFGIEFSGMYDELAGILRMMCDGARARDIPVVRPRHVFLGVSTTNAKTMGLTLNPRILPLATTIH